MMKPPSYFEDIRAKAARRWDQLEGDPELAGPWHQLFKQVQSPRHVLSELLQNADDVKAKNAWAKIENNEFIFEHDGIDFNDVDLASLCKFGFSNKRNLTTIGFRGVGFKSTFSMGDEVRLFTPTLSVLFRCKRFTEPIWIDHNSPSKTTQVRVQLKDEFRRQELEKNLNEWATNPISLLFFHNIKRLTIQGTSIHRHSVETGPVPRSEWIKLSESQEKPFLLIRSKPDPFPQDALDEVRQERMSTDDLELPPCTIDLIVGLEEAQMLFAILPTGVETELPFSCNAPFIQDPARLKIKEIEISPTNRWLLERAGQLAAKAMLFWLRRADLNLEERCKAYVLFPDVDRENDSLQGGCASTCEEAFEILIKDTEFLLTETQTLVGEGGCITAPLELYNIWEPDQISGLLDKESRPLLCRHVDPESLQKLVNWHMVDKIEKSSVLDIFSSHNVTKPDTWRQLLLLWDFLYDEVRQSKYSIDLIKKKRLQIFPVTGKKILYPADSIVRLGEKRILSSREDREFLSDYVLVLNRKWTRFLAEQRRIAEEHEDKVLQRYIRNAYDMMSILGLEEASDVSQVIEQVISKFSIDDSHSIKDYICLAHIAAALGASVPLNFIYITRSGQKRAVEDGVIGDVDGDLDCFVEDKWYENNVLHEDYWVGFTSCTQSDWTQWVKSERSHLLTFVSPKLKEKYVWSKLEICEFLKERSVKSGPYYPYVRNFFKIKDWDFEEEHWQYWKSFAEKDSAFWGKLLKRILKMPHRQWSKCITAEALQVATTGNSRAITFEEILAAWIIKFSNLCCLQDTYGIYHEPAELMRRTPETESFLDIEPFIQADYDTEEIRPLLIKLGVRDSPTGPDHLLDRIRALSKAKTAPIYEVEKWYHRLDQIILKCSTEELQRVKDAFAKEDLILTETGEWVKSSDAFITNSEEDVPGALILHPSVRQLQLWAKIGLPERPTVQMVLEWLKGIPSGKKLDPDEMRRVKSILPRYPDTIWTKYGHWLNLDGQWIETEKLSFKLTMQSLVPWANLFPAIKQKTSDFQMLTIEACMMPQFSALPNLSACLEYRIKDGFGHLIEPQQKPWIEALGNGLARIVLDDNKDMECIQRHALRLAQTIWQPVQGLEVVPYIDETPAGTERKIDVLWKGNMLYVDGQQVSKLFKPIAQEIARPFDRQDIADAIKACIERTADFVTEYLEENFKLHFLEGPIIGEKLQASDKADESGTLISTTEEISGKISAESVISYENEDDGTEVTDNKSQSQTSSRVIKPKLIKIYARSRGYEKVGEFDSYRHPDGSYLRKSNGGPFHFEEYDSNGQLIQSYWLKDHCLMKKPLNLNTDVWSLCQKSPEEYTLILTNPDGNPIEFKGTMLLKLVESGRIKLSPAEYRLSYEEEHE